MDGIIMNLSLPVDTNSAGDNFPYEPSVLSSASSTHSSIFSDSGSSQSSESSTSSNYQPCHHQTRDWVTDASQSIQDLGLLQQHGSASQVFAKTGETSSRTQHADASLSRARSCDFLNGAFVTNHHADYLAPPERHGLCASSSQRRHPRRTLASDASRPPPQLVRQCDRKGTFVDNLVDSAAQMVEVIWPLSAMPCRQESSQGKGVLPLRTFIQETLRRSRTSYSTLQVALYYLVLIKSHVPRCDFTMEQPTDIDSFRALQCGRRMFLAALILASKYLQDRNFSARAWSKISGLKICEINGNEMTFLSAVEWRLHIPDGVFERWTDIVLKYTPSADPRSMGAPCSGVRAEWKSVIPYLTPELKGFEHPFPKMGTRAVHMMPGFLRPTLLSGAPVADSACLSPMSVDGIPTSNGRHAADVPILRTPCRGVGLSRVTEQSSLLAPPPFLEPSLDSEPPAPRLARAPLLPTPQLIPSSTTAIGPVECAQKGFAKSHTWSSAMSQVQNACFARSTADQWCSIQTAWPTSSENSSVSSRRSSSTRSVSSMSSPESMISDTSSLSSRTSTNSSISSAMCAPGQSKNQLERLATCRNARLANLACGLKPKMNPSCLSRVRTLDTTFEAGLGRTMEDTFLGGFVTSSPEPFLRRSHAAEGVSRSIPVLQREPIFSMDTSMNASAAFNAPPSENGRKRERPRVDSPMQDNVRDLLARDPQTHQSWSGVLPDETKAKSFLGDRLASSFGPGDGINKAPLSSSRVALSRASMDSCLRFPIQKDLRGRKRACCGAATEGVRPQPLTVTATGDYFGL